MVDRFISRASGGMADALASGASVLRDVGVQVPLRPPRAVLRTAGVKVTNSKEAVTFVTAEAKVTGSGPSQPARTYAGQGLIIGALGGRKLVYPAYRGNTASMAPTTSGASGSVRGRNRLITSPSGATRNFSKFH